MFDFLSRDMFKKAMSRPRLFGAVLSVLFMLLGVFLVSAQQDVKDSNPQAHTSDVLGAESEDDPRPSIDTELSTITDTESTGSEAISGSAPVSVANTITVASEKPVTPSEQEVASKKTTDDAQEQQSDSPVDEETTDEQDNDSQDDQEDTPSYDFNLNDTWYISQIAATGYYIICWPIEITIENFDECTDKNHPLSNVWFYGVGISLDQDEAFELASKDLVTKLQNNRIAGLKGGGGDPFVLTESHCQDHNLSCGRW